VVLQVPATHQELVQADQVIIDLQEVVRVEVVVALQVVVADQAILEVVEGNNV